MSNRLAVIVGPMFSGKSSRLIQLVKRYKIAKKKIQVFKPTIDVRYGSEAIKTHDKLDLEEHTRVIPEIVSSVGDITGKIQPDTDVITFEEVQFFDEKLLEVINYLYAIQKRTVICAGLDMDFMGKPFGIVPQLLSMATDIEKLTAVCFKCNGVATRTYRRGLKQDKILVGGSELYEARCLSCWSLDSDE